MITVNDDKGVNLYIKPTYAVAMRARQHTGTFKTMLQKLNEENLKDNEHKGGLSEKAQKRLVNAVNWLILSAKNKRVYDKELGKSFYFKVNFVTLTIPTLYQDFSDHFFKKKLLHNFINQMMYRHDLKNYVWKVEAQANGNIHVHITTDTYLPWRSVREVWNRILDRNGILKKYTDRMNAMSEFEYIKAFFVANKTTIPDLKRRFKEGKEKGWLDPNSTDVRAVHKIKDIGAYISKYMSKTDENRRAMEGRIWACSYSISRASKLTVNVPIDATTKVFDYFHTKYVKFKQLTMTDKLSGDLIPIGSLFMFSLEFWDNHVGGELQKIVNEIRYKVRHALFREDENSLSLI